MSEAQPLRIVLIDDHALVRAGLRRILEAEEGWVVEAEAGDLDRGLRAVLGHKPDVVVLDLNLGGVSSLDAIGEFLERSPRTKIVVLTMQADPACARDAMRSGGSAYILKEAAEAELVEAVRAAAEGMTYLNPRVGAALASIVEASPGEASDLTDREDEVLRLLALGHTNAEIANKLFLSRRTVESHRANVQRKLGLTSRAELTRHALERGLLEA